MKPYQILLRDIERTYTTNVTAGLSAQEAQERLTRDGLNKLPESTRDPWLLVFLRQFQNPLIYVLLAAAALIFFVGEQLDAFIISGVLFFNAIVGTIQEGRTRTILDTLQRFIVANSVVLRDGKKLLIEDSNLVVGDIVILQEGERVPADVRIVESNNLRIDEAILTGESVGVKKQAEALAEQTLVHDQNNMAFKGTFVLSGYGKAVVIATGQNTEIGKIHVEVEQIETDVPLRRELDHLSHLILLFILGICVFLFIIGVLSGKPLNELLVILTALFICVIPEGLPVVLTLVLVTGVYRMAKKRVLVKNLQAVDALGRADVAVIDKTGTLTRNEMVVTHAVTVDNPYTVTGVGYHEKGDVLLHSEPVREGEADLMLLGSASALLSGAELTYQPKHDLFDIKGAPTEAAMQVFAAKLGLKRNELEKLYKKIYEIPFTSEQQYHASFYEKDGAEIAFINGSPEVVIARCRDVAPVLRTTLTQFLEEGLRVVAFATKKYTIGTLANNTDEEQFHDAIKEDLELLGFIGIQDAIRTEVPAVVQQARDIGLQVVMATGDHKKTALFIAKKVGIFHEGDEVIDGSEMEKLTDAQLRVRLRTVTVFSRVTPAHKFRIVKLFQSMDKIVAMTGDGVNDAPSLVAADLGIAMGGIGTEVAKEASDIVLMDDSFTNIMGAVEEGRHIFFALRRVILYFFATNFGEVLVILFALCLGLPLPILAAQILWLNLVTDGFLDTALSMEPQEKDLLLRQKVANGQRLVDGNILLKMLFMALPMGICSLIMFYWYYQTDIVLARTITLVTMAMFQWFNAWNCRSETLSVFSLGLFANIWLILATTLVFGLQVVILHVPILQKIFRTVPLTLHQWVVILLISSSIFFLEELRKLFVRRQGLTKP